MDLMAHTAVAVTSLVVSGGVAYAVLTLLKRKQARTETQSMTRALTITHAIFTALEHVPDGLINRDLRRGLVLLLTHHIGVLERTNSRHPHLQDMQNRTALLNRLPSGLAKTRLRNKTERRHASVALEELGKIVAEATQLKEIEVKAGDLAKASAKFTSQQVAVHTARQAAKDAENVRAYPQALNFARQAQALCKQLPPLVGKTLGDAVSQDIERLEGLAHKGLRI